LVSVDNSVDSVFDVETVVDDECDWILLLSTPVEDVKGGVKGVEVSVLFKMDRV
jgi:hypothetical protein